jgi:hypothetical protein
MRRLMALAAFCPGVTVFTAPLLARPLESELPPKTPACYERIYDAAHLAAHPKQEVTRIRLVHTGQSAPNEVMFLTIDIAVRGKREVYSLGGVCEADGRGLNCTPEWNAGTFRVEASQDGSLLVTNRSMLFNPSNYAAEEPAPNAIKLEGDDRTWRLQRTGEKCSNWPEAGPS